MPRARRVKPVTMLAANPSTAAAACGLSYDRDIAPAIRRGEIPCYSVGVRRRVIICDVLRWLRRAHPRIN